jgi:hypothetical protein
MKIVRTDFDIGDIQGNDPLSLDVDDPILMLERALHAHESAARDHYAILLERIGGENNVGDACFVLERKEDKTLGSSRALPCDHATGNMDEVMVRQPCEVIGGYQACLSKCRAVVGKRMRPGGEARAGVIGAETFMGGHLFELQGCLGWGRGQSRAAQQRADGPAGLLQLPPRIAPVLDIAK